MNLKPGELFLAGTNEGEVIAYLSLITDEKGLERKDHVYRKGPPSHEIIKGGVEFISKLDHTEPWRTSRTK